MTGDLSKIYGLANLDTLSIKRQRCLPAKAKVYDAINFASEIATHQATPQGSRRLNGYIGDLISGEYDLEGTADGPFAEFSDFLIGNQDAQAALAAAKAN
jgi:hypothetical protein